MMLMAPLFIVLLNVCLLVCSQITWKIALNRTPLNGIHNLGLVLKETFTSSQWLGLLFLVGGAFLLAE
ncbi:hypothetical protein SAMN04487897_101515 [Paenibacillus sp. yr247]|nr:hypothetical protein SAMN04487897_101515 [Paenibacillus sp. yr247]